MKNGIKNIWNKFKEWVIDKFGGYNEKQYTEIKDQVIATEKSKEIVKKIVGIKQSENTKLKNELDNFKSQIITIQSEIDLTKHPWWSNDMDEIRQQSENLVIRDFGKQMLNYAQYFKTEDQKLIVCANIINYKHDESKYGG